MDYRIRAKRSEADDDDSVTSGNALSPHATHVEAPNFIIITR